MIRSLAAALVLISIGHAQTSDPAAFDVLVRHGTILDGSGAPRYDADIGVRRGFIAVIGDLKTATAATEIEARGLFVAPGFINIHSHASPDALPTAVNMLTQGVTTEILNADGGGPPDLAQQMTMLAAPGLALNVGGYIGFNTVWQQVNGNADRRPTQDDIRQMRELVATGLTQGAWGVSAGLDYKPGYFASTEEVVRIVDVARSSRTNFTNHDRVTPESNFSSKAGIDETLAIGQKAGLVPVVTHMKATGREQGTAGTLLASMDRTTKQGAYTAADAYPYLAGQTGLGSLIIPAWAQDGGRDAMLKRFADPALRARIITEAEQAMTARFGGPHSVYLPRTQQELTTVMQEMNAGAGETILRILETGDPGAILRFGTEADLVKILQHPATSMACDCGATTATRVHPRFYGSFPRVLGHYVREQKIMSWEQAILQSSALPAATIGMTDRGLVAVGMAADLVVFDPATVIDRATYENPAVLSEGIRYVLVNGTVALKDGAATGTHGGRALLRSTNMPSRPISIGARRVTVKGTSAATRVTMAVSQPAGARTATGSITIDSPDGSSSIASTAFGVLQIADGWASVSGRGKTAAGDERTFVAIIDQRDPSASGSAVVVVSVDGAPPWRGTLPLSAVSLTAARRP